MGNCAFLEVVSEGEIARHLEKRVVTRRDTDFVDIQCAHTFLDRGSRIKRRGLLTQEVRLEGNHSRVNKEQVRIVQDQRRAGDGRVPSFNKVFREPFPDLVCVHERTSLYTW